MQLQLPYDDQWNIFARELEKILNKRGLRIGQLNDRYDKDGFALLHPAKADRLTKSLASPCNFAVLSPIDLDRLEETFGRTERPFTEDEMRCLRAAVMATAVERILMSRMKDKRIALMASNDVFNILYAAMKLQPDLMMARAKDGIYTGEATDDATGDADYEQAMDLIDEAELALHAQAQAADQQKQLEYAQQALHQYDRALASLQASQIPTHDNSEWIMWFEATQQERARTVALLEKLKGTSR